MTRNPWPARYEARVEGILDNRWAEWFEGLRIDRHGTDTTLSGTLNDQSALYGVLGKLCQLGLVVVTLRRLPLDKAARTSRGSHHGSSESSDQRSSHPRPRSPRREGLPFRRAGGR